PIQPVVDGAVAEFAAGRLEIVLELLVHPEDEMQRPRDDERRLALDVGQRRIGGEPDDDAFVEVPDVVAPDRMAGKRAAVIVRGADADRDARQAGDRLDDPDELRWPKNAPELPVAGRKIGDTDRAAALVGEDRRYDRGIAKILRLEVGHVVQHDV